MIPELTKLEKSLVDKVNNMPPGEQALQVGTAVDNFINARLQNKVADSSTPEDVQGSSAPSRFDVDVSNEVTSSDLAEPVSLDDVRAERAAREQATETAGSLDDFDTDLAEPTPFNNPEQFILSSLYGDREQTDAERQAERERRGITRTAEGISSSLESARERAVETTDFGEQSQALARTNEQIAQRQARFRREMRAFETDAEKRGADRQFVQSERAKLEADATAELADLYIIQNAQQGNVQAARDYIDTAVDNRYRSIQTELQQRQAALAELIPTLEKEEKQRALQLQIALGERERNIKSEKDEAKEKRELMISVAQNGGGVSAQRAVLNAGSLDEAIVAASPFIGLLERQAAQRSAANAALTRKKNLIELALAGDTAAINELGEFGRTLVAKQELAKELGQQEAFEANVNQGIALQQRITRYSGQLDNELGIALSTGAFQSPLLTGGLAGPLGGSGSGLLGFVPGVGNVMNYSKAVNAKNDFLGTVTEMVNISGFDNLIAYKAAGATFGALSDSEFTAIKSASGPLAALARYEDGKVAGFDASEAEVINAYNLAMQELNNQLEELNISVLDEDSNLEIISLTRE